MEVGRWLLTVYDDRDRVLEESTHETLNDVAAVFGLPRGNDLFRYRTDPAPRHARRLMLDRFRVWFTVEARNEDSRRCLLGLTFFFFPPFLCSLVAPQRYLKRCQTAHGASPRHCRVSCAFLGPLGAGRLICFFFPTSRKESLRHGVSPRMTRLKRSLLQAECARASPDSLFIFSSRVPATQAPLSTALRAFSSPPQTPPPPAHTPRAESA